MLPRAALLLVLLVLAGCSSEGPTSQTGPATPTAFAEAVAAGLAAGDLTDVPVSELTPKAATRALTTVTDGMDGIEPMVTVADIEHADGSKTATVTLSWEWPLGEDSWSYDSTAELLYADQAWQLRWQPAVVEPRLRAHDRLERSTLPADRGDIVGAHDTALVTERKVTKFGVDKAHVSRSAAVASARRLADLLGIDEADYVDTVKAAGDDAFVIALVLRTPDVPQPVWDGYQDIPGVIAVSTTAPLAPSADFAAPILGRVGEVTAEMIKADPDRYHLGDVAGLSGLQQRYDERLAGTPGVEVEAVSPQRTRSRELFRAKPVAGRPLRITLDQRLQTEAERALADIGPMSALVALRPSTGEVLAAANGPGNDGLNMATYGQSAPGSTFKIVTSLAMLRRGLTPDSSVECPPSIEVDGKRFDNYSDYPPSALGRITLRDAVANSCNTAFVGSDVSVQALQDAAASLGFGIDSEVGYPAYFGSLGPVDASETESAAMRIGQGQVLASPLVMAAVIASVQSGDTVTPTLVRSVPLSAEDPPTPLTRSEATDLRALLRAVVTDGSGAGLADVPGQPIIAKTGTAEFERDSHVLTHTWMVAAQGDLAVAVYVDTGESGSQTSGPILETFLRSIG